MIDYLLKRVALTIPLLLVVSTAVFGLVHMIPGDPIDFMIGENAALDRKADLRRAYHLDKPILISLRPWWGREQAVELLGRAGSLLQSASPSPAEADVRQELEDIGLWAAPTLRRLWQDEATPLDLRAKARRGLVLALRGHRPEDELRNLQLSQLLGYDEAGISAEELVLPWLDANAGSLGASPSQRIGATFGETQYAQFFRDLLAGELRSLHTNRSVAETLAEEFPMTLLLALASLLVAMLVAIPIGTLAAARQYSWVDNASMVGALVGISMPNFWLGPLLIIAFSIQLGWFPVSGAQHASSLVLPAVTLGLGMSAILTRMTRASVLDTIHEDYVRTARAKGLSEFRVIARHALRAALIPVVTILGLQFGALLAGSIITEEIFGWPGIGREVISAIRTRDFPMVQGCVLLVASTYVVVNTVTDALYALLNPRVRLK